MHKHLPAYNGDIWQHVGSQMAHAIEWLIWYWVDGNVYQFEWLADSVNEYMTVFFWE